VVVNLSRFAQAVELDLSRFSGYTPEEVFGGNKFPVIKDNPYLVTLGSHDYYWFLLQREEEVIRMEDIFGFVPQLSVSRNWEDVFREKTKERLEEKILPSYIMNCRWFGGKGHKIGQVRIIEDIPVGKDGTITHFLFLRVRYIEGEPEVYLLPVSFSTGEEAAKIIEVRPHVIVARVRAGDLDGIIYEGVYSEEFHKTLLRMIERRQSVKGLWGQLVAYPGRLFRTFRGKELSEEKSHVLKGEQSNTSILFGNELFLKLYRRLYEGINPELEIGRFLTERVSFHNVPPFIGAIEYRKPGSEPVVISMLQTCVPNQGDAWTYTLDSLGGYFDRVLSKRSELQEIPKAPYSFVEMTSQEVPILCQELIGGVYLEMANLLGKRTAELHLNLSSDRKDPSFLPEHFSILYQRSLFQSMQSLTKKNVRLLRKNITLLTEDIKEEANEIINLENEIIERFKVLLAKKISAMKTRVHGDYHLGQVLHTGNDFIIIDFEGEPARPISERRLKRSPLSDVAGMMRSFHYASYSVILKQAIRPEDIQLMEPWADLWYRYVSGIFLKGYLQVAADAPFLPKETGELEILLHVFLLEKAVYELGYELNNRPNWIIIPIMGIKHLLEGQ